MKNFDEYKPKFSYPNKAEGKRYYLYKQGHIVLDNVTRERVKEFLRNSVSPTDKLRFADFNVIEVAQKQGFLIEEIGNLDTYQEQLDAYRKDEARLINEFTNDLFEDYGVSDHPGRHVMFSEAWERGHSAGFGEVYNCFSNILDFVKRVEEATKELVKLEEADKEVPVYKVVWIECERGWGQRPFHTSYYDTFNQAKKEINDHWADEKKKNPSGQTPECYIRPDEPILVMLDRVEYEKYKWQKRKVEDSYK
jgi:hypothetical protein